MIEKIFGYQNQVGEIKKVATIKIHMDNEQNIKDLYIFQSDMAVLGHFSLHTTCKNNKSPRYHLQVNNLDMFAQEDRSKFPEILNAYPFDIHEYESVISLQAVPIHLIMDLQVNLYKTITKNSEILKCQDTIADYSNLKINSRSAAILQICIIPRNAKKNYEEYKEKTQKKLGSRLDLWWLKVDISPSILGYIFH